MPEQHGWTAPGFEKVRAAFEQNFAEGLEVGAAFSAYHRGQKVVDLWGGVADEVTGRPWDEDAIVLVFSTTKGMTAVCANKLAQEGRLDVDAPVVQYWPEFGANGKESVPVSYLLSHQAGLYDVDASLSLADTLAWDPVCEALAAQAPKWEPGSQHGYHATTYGWLVGEVVRRITGRSIGTYLRQEIADPLGLDLWIGLPADKEPRVAALVGGLVPDTDTLDEATREMINQFMGPESVLGRALTAPCGLLGMNEWRSAAVRAAEIPAAGGVADARSVARLYASCIGEVDGIRTLTAEQLKRATTQQTTGPNVVIMGIDLQFGLGFMVPSSVISVPGSNSFGHFGAGGSMGWADPDANLAFGYVMNKMATGLAGDPRTTRLVAACYDAIK